MAPELGRVLMEIRAQSRDRREQIEGELHLLDSIIGLIDARGDSLPSVNIAGRSASLLEFVEGEIRRVSDLEGQEKKQELGKLSALMLFVSRLHEAGIDPTEKIEISLKVCGRQTSVNGIPPAEGVLPEGLQEISIGGLGLSTWTHNALVRREIRTVKQLQAMSDEDLLEVRQIGVGRLAEIKTKLTDFLSAGQQQQQEIA